MDPRATRIEEKDEEQISRELFFEEELQKMREVIATPAAELVDKIFPVPVQEDEAQVHPYFENYSMIVIIANSLQIGAECQWQREDSERLFLAYTYLDRVFVTLFVIEIAIKVVFLGCGGFFYTTPKAGKPSVFKFWNALDLALTGSMFFDLALIETGRSHDIVKVLAKISRLGRCLRLVRLLRVLKAQPELVTVVEGLILSSSALIWILLALAIFLYFFAILFVLQVDHDIFAKNDLDDDADLCTRDPYFCNLSTAMLTLLNVVVGAEWASIIQPLLRYQPMLVIPFLAFFVITSFGIANIIVGVIVDATAETKTKIQWANKRNQLLRASSMWYNIVERGHSIEQIDKLKADGLDNEYLHAKNKRDLEIKQLIQRMLDINLLSLPEGTRAESLLQLLDRGYRAIGEMSHEDFTISLGRLLLADQEGLMMLGLVNQAKQFTKVRGIDDRLMELGSKTLAAKKNSRPL